jgi:O-antigen ligase
MASILHRQGRMVSAARWQAARQHLQADEDSPIRQVKTPGWDLLLVCVAVYVATAVGRLHELFPILLPLKPALLAGVSAIGLYLLQATGQRSAGLLRSSTTTCLLWLVLWAALCVPGALNQGVAFRSWTEFLRTIVMCLVVAASVRRARDIERLILVYFGVTVVYVAVVLSRFELGAENWRLGRLYYYDANDLATLIATAMPFGLYFVLARRHPLERALAGAGLAVLAVGLIRSGSRGGLLAFLAVTAFVLLRVTTIPARSRLVGLVVILAVVFGAASDQYWSQMQTIVHPHQDYNLTSEQGRVRIWKRGIGYIAAHPVFGVGELNFQVAEGTISPLAKLQERGIGVRWGAAHNTYIQAGAEIGIPGLLLFLGVIGSAFASLRRAAQRTPQASAAGNQVARLAQSLMTALVGFVVGAFFLSLVYHDMLYVLVALAIGLAKVARSDAARGSGPIV